MAPAPTVGPRQVARLRSSSKTSLSAAADLIVKPSTPPRMAASSMAVHGVKMKGAICGNMTMSKSSSATMHTARLSSTLEANSTEAISVPSMQADEKQIDVLSGSPHREQQLLVNDLNKHVLVEVRSLSGESLLHKDFPLAESVLSVKNCILKTRGVPLWQQFLTFQGDLLNDGTKLDELGLSTDGAVFEIVLKAGPDTDDVERLAHAARDLEDATIASNIRAMPKAYLKELSAMARPPQMCEAVCCGALHLLAGRAGIPTKRNGSPKKSDWDACKQMLSNPDFKKELLQLPCDIDHGKLTLARITGCRQHIQAVHGDSDTAKINNVARCSLAAQNVITFMIAVCKYYDCAEEFRDRFGASIHGLGLQPHKPPL